MATTESAGTPDRHLTPPVAPEFLGFERETHQSAPSRCCSRENVRFKPPSGSPVAVLGPFVLGASAVPLP